ncbi:MAG: NAD(P) transhydrogenase subunit alpha [Gammaproteobacteria bacterium]
MPVTVGVIRETAPDETRVALVPEVAKKLRKSGARLIMETGAAVRARFADADFEDIEIAPAASTVLAAADVLLRVQPPALVEAAALRPGSIVIGYLQPHMQKELIGIFCERKITSFAIELVPRISRAQSMDALSSQAAVAGTRRCWWVRLHSTKFLPMLTTAAGTIRPSRALIMGAGVAGLQAIATARRLGAVVEAFDVRAATREQVESLGAKFVDTGVTADGAGGYARELTTEEKARQQAVVNDRLALADLVITTAAVPGRPAPRLIDRATVERMKPGAVIVDLGAESGGNCELTKPGETVTAHGVTIIGPVNLAATVARDASEMYARNLYNFLMPAISKEGELAIDWQDEVFAGAVLTHDGSIRHEPTRKALA